MKSSTTDLFATTPKSFTFPAPPVIEDGRMELGSQAPLSLSGEITDSGQVRLGGQAPLFVSDRVRDAGLVRLGGQSPIF